MSLLSQLFEEQSGDVLLDQLETAGAVLAVDIGSVHTRALLFDVVEGSYRFVAYGEAPTTTGDPWNNAIEGVYEALQQISQATGRTLVNEEGVLIIPAKSGLFGVDNFVATASAGRPIRAVLVGLVPEMSLKSARRAAESIYLSLVDTISLADPRSPEEQIRAVLSAQPDLIMVVGGTDGGAVDSLRHHLATVILACSLMDSTVRPTLLYAGNKDLAEEVREKADEVGVQVLVADNVRPALDVEYLDGAQRQLASLYHRHKAFHNPGFREIGNWSEEGILPTSYGFGRLVHLLGVLKGQSVLGVDVGSATTVVAASLSGRRYLNVFGQLGIGHSAHELLKHVRREQIARWLSFTPRQSDDLMDYVWNRSLFPHAIPVSREALETEYAVAREIMRVAVLSARQSWHGVPMRGLLPHFGTLLLSGATLTRPPHYGWSALLALDALQPVGITRLLLDPYGIAAALGAVASSKPSAVVQVLERGAFVDLGTVIAPSGHVRRGEMVLRGTLRREGKASEEPIEVTGGTLAVIPLGHGERAELIVHSAREIEGLERRRKVTLTGGELGLIVDARGRPWRFPRAEALQQEWIARWRAALVGEA